MVEDSDIINKAYKQAYNMVQNSMANIQEVAKEMLKKEVLFY